MGGPDACTTWANDVMRELESTRQLQPQPHKDNDSHLGDKKFSHEYNSFRQLLGGKLSKYRQPLTRVELLLDPASPYCQQPRLDIPTPHLPNSSRSYSAETDRTNITTEATHTTDMTSEAPANPSWDMVSKSKQEHPTPSSVDERAVRSSLLTKFRRSTSISFTKLFSGVKMDGGLLRRNSYTPSSFQDDSSFSKNDSDTRSIETTGMQSVFEWIAHKESEVENLDDHPGMTIEQYERRGSWLCPQGGRARDDPNYLCRHRNCPFHYPRDENGNQIDAEQLYKERRAKRRQEREARRRVSNPSRYCPPEWHMDRVQ